MKFSERRGLAPVSDVIQKDGMSEELRNSLWNTLDYCLWSREGVISYSSISDGMMRYFSRGLWSSFLKEPMDVLSTLTESQILRIIRDRFFEWSWYEVYDFLEWVLNYPLATQCIDAVNRVLERELSAYRFVGGKITDITDVQEIEMLETALADNDFPGVRAHLEAALDLLSRREKPDYRNSIKESISAVESMAQHITGNPKATLGDALKTLEKSGTIHPALKKGFSNLYGYTSNADGIRHAMLEEPDLSAADAKFFLLSCTSFINYLKSKIPSE